MRKVISVLGQISAIVLFGLILTGRFRPPQQPQLCVPVDWSERQVHIFTLNPTLVGVPMQINGTPVRWDHLGKGRREGYAMVDMDKSEVKLVVERMGQKEEFELLKPSFSDPNYHGTPYQSAPRFWVRLLVDDHDRLWARLQPNRTNKDVHLDILGKVIK